MEDIYIKLTDNDDKAAYEFAKQIDIESAETDKYLKEIPVFVSMLTNKSSFIRARGFILICSQARWANEQQIENVFFQMCSLLNDSKPTVVRQCLKALHEVVLFRPEMSKIILEAVDNIDLSKYKESMTPLICQDIEELKKVIEY